ncbi:hypothetical protein IWX90DRAFT_159818 [Phyllosticta citrichinensis]|uniref:Uncharacterized protein n=1 Tax=Phyllosticta citrichinensis TaxID=1130410 RepID=A0ABR1Y0P2_9PEZI
MACQLSCRDRRVVLFCATALVQIHSIQDYNTAFPGFSSHSLKAVAQKFSLQDKVFARLDMVTSDAGLGRIPEDNWTMTVGQGAVPKSDGVLGILALKRTSRSTCVQSLRSTAWPLLEIAHATVEILRNDSFTRAGGLGLDIVSKETGKENTLSTRVCTLEIK